MELGEIIHKKRKEKKLSLEKLGELVGVSKVTISKWEKGDIINMKRDKIANLSSILDIPLEYFIYEENEIADFITPTTDFATKSAKDFTAKSIKDFVTKYIKDIDKENCEEISPEEFYDLVMNIIDRTKMKNNKKDFIKQTLGYACEIGEDNK